MLRNLDLPRAWQLFQIGRFGFLMGIMVLLANSDLTLDEIGVWETFLFVSATASAFWISGLMNGLLAMYPKEPQKQRLLGQAVVALFGSAVMVSAVMTLFPTGVKSLFSMEGDVGFYSLIPLYLLLNSPGFLAEHIYLLKEDKKGLLTMGAFMFTLQFVLVVGPVYLFGSLMGAIHGLIGAAGIKLFWTLILLGRWGHFSYNRTLLRNLLILAAPLVGALLLGRSAEYIDGLIVVNHFDQEPFSIFRYGARELPFVFLLAHALSAAMIPRIAANKEAGLAELKQRSSRLMDWLFPVSIVLLLTSQWIYPFVFGERFTDSAQVFNVYLLLIISRLVFPQAALTGLKRTGIQMVSGSLEVLLNVALSLYLVQDHGLVGVAYATVIAFAVDKVFLLAACGAMGIRAGQILDWRRLVGYSLLLLTVFWWVVQ
jgi:O-antigen/teichoic acid export membrane protein